jgi:tyrosyl-tRNA synthetase
MSKSLDNAIGIHEPPVEMYGKIMAISDEKMWSYYELLTDVLAIQIDALRQGIKTGERHPMEIKKSLASLIVSDFHSRGAAERAAENWAEQFQKGGVPDDIEEVDASVEVTHDGRVRLDKLLARSGLADSVSDAVRKLKQRAVKVNGEVTTDTAVLLAPNTSITLTLQVGRKIKKVRIHVNLIVGTRPINPM